jgi:hypothetical protein
MRCDAITLEHFANAMQMRKLIRITSPGMMSYFIKFLYPYVWLLLSLALEATTYDQ